MLSLVVMSGFELSDPKPLTPGTMVHQTGARYAREGMVIIMKPVVVNEFLKRLKKEGIDAELLKQDKLRDYLESLAIFEIQFENEGSDVLMFTPEQLVLRDRGSVVGFQLSMYDLLATPYGHSDPRMEALAEMFIKSSLTIDPGKTARHLVAFKPVSMTKRFPKRVELTFDRIYYGITNRTVACQFKVRYKKR